MENLGEERVLVRKVAGDHRTVEQLSDVWSNKIRRLTLVIAKYQFAESCFAETRFAGFFPTLAKPLF
jgi:hypothetical protein